MSECLNGEKCVLISVTVSVTIHGLGAAHSNGA